MKANDDDEGKPTLRQTASAAPSAGLSIRAAQEVAVRLPQDQRTAPSGASRLQVFRYKRWIGRVVSGKSRRSVGSNPAGACSQWRRCEDDLR